MLMRKVTNGNAIDNYTCPLFQQAHLLLLQHSWLGPDSHQPPAGIAILSDSLRQENLPGGQRGPVKLGIHVLRDGVSDTADKNDYAGAYPHGASTDAAGHVIYHCYYRRKLYRCFSVHRLAENMLGYLFLDIICSLKLRIFFDLHSRKTVRFSEQIMFKEKCSHLMEAVIYRQKSPCYPDRP